MDLWPNWIRRDATDVEIRGSSPCRSAKIFKNLWSTKVKEGELMKISKAKKFKKNSDIRKFYNENFW